MSDEQPTNHSKTLAPEQYEKLGTALVDLANDLCAVIGPTETARMLMALTISFMETRQPSWVTAKLLKQLSVRLATNGPRPN